MNIAKETNLYCIFLIVISILTILSGVTLITNDAIGANLTNSTIITRAYVWNTEPILNNVVISPIDIDLVPGNWTIINCTGYYWDYNGWQDVKNGTVNATLYDISNGFNSSNSDDNNNHYTNNSCNICQPIAGTSTNGTCTCFFAVWYYANNATWQCNMTIRDSGGNATQRKYNLSALNSLTADATFNELLGINVGPSELNYGNLSVTETSSSMVENITNWGNIPINISVYGYANETTTGNLSMICELGSIPAGYQRYSTNSSATFGTMTQVSNESTGISNFNLPQRTLDSDYGSDRNQTYWKLNIPLSVGGACNGTLVFGANEAAS